MPVPISIACVDPASNHSKNLVALVDDDPQILDALSTWLHSIGLKPRSFANAESLLVALKDPASLLSQSLAGAILDINLKEMHGVELAHLLRKSFPGIPLVMITALSSEEISQFGQLPPKAACLKKPFNLESLEDALFGWIH